jgi:hypothetical protein
MSERPHPPTFLSPPDQARLRRPDMPLADLNEKQIAITEEWYAYIAGQLEGWRRPELVTGRVEPVFAEAVRALVASRVEFKSIRRGVGTLFNGTSVQGHLGSYYRSFPSTSEDVQLQRNKIAYQEPRLAVVQEGFAEYPEIQAVSALQRAFHQNRQLHATRATYAILTAYGDTILGG